MNTDRINALAEFFLAGDFSVRHISAECEAVFEGFASQQMPGVGTANPILKITLTYDLPKGTQGRTERLSLDPESAKAFGEVLLGFAKAYGGAA